MKKITLILSVLLLICNYASADYKKNIDDEMKIYQIEVQVNKIINNINFIIFN